MGWVGPIIQCFIIIYTLHSSFSPRTTTEHTYHTQETYNDTQSRKCNTDRKLFDFEGVGYLPVKIWGNLDRRTAQSHSVPRQRGEVNSVFRFNLLNSTKCGLLMYQLVIITLVESGDVEINPGPSQHKLKKYCIKFPCLHCNIGINKRRVNCVNCGNISHVKCVEKLSIEKYEEFVSRNEIIPFKCKFCIVNSDNDIALNTQQNPYYYNKRSTTIAAAAVNTDAVPSIRPKDTPTTATADCTITQTNTATTAEAAVTAASAAARERTEETTSVTRNNLARNDNTDNSVNNRRVIRPSLVTDSRFDCFKKKRITFCSP